jgi:hypothetical protein
VIAGTLSEDEAASTSKLLLYKVDATGDVTWARTFDDGTIGDQFGIGLDVTAGGDLLVATSRARSTGTPDGWTLRLDGNGHGIGCRTQPATLLAVPDSTAWSDWIDTTQTTYGTDGVEAPTGSIPVIVDDPCACRDADLDGFDSCAECDDFLASVFPGALEINDGFDNQCPGDDGFGLADEVEGGLEVAASQVCWEAQPGATAYEIVRATSPDFSVGCQIELVIGTCWDDTTPPAPGEIVYYLVRSAMPFAGAWGFDSTGAPREPSCAN